MFGSLEVHSENICMLFFKESKVVVVRILLVIIRGWLTSKSLSVKQKVAIIAVTQFPPNEFLSKAVINEFL